MQHSRYVRGAWRHAGPFVIMSALYGAAPVAAARATMEPAAVRHVQISAFRTSTVTAVDAWVAQPGLYPLPVHVSAFPAGTMRIGSIFLFTRAVPHVTTEQVVVHGPHGLLVTSGRPYVLQHASNGIYEYLSAPPPLAYPDGRYNAVVLIDGRRAAQTTFTVG